MFCMLKKKYVSKHVAYISKHNSNRENQVILLMIPNGEGQNYVEVKELSALLRGTIRRITSKHHVDFYCLNSLHSFTTENKRKSPKNSI